MRLLPKNGVRTTSSDKRKSSLFSAAFLRAEEFLTQNGASYGFSTEHVDGLQEAERETLKDLYEADPSWTAKGQSLIDIIFIKSNSVK